MLLDQLESLNEAKLQKLCDESYEESVTLDFKRELPGTSDKDKQEFLKDVCAFANADGGDLVYGITEQSGVAKLLSPIANVTETSDAAKRRLGQVLERGLEPRIQGALFYPIQTAGGYILVVRVPASFDGPHRYLFDGQSKFVMRNGTHTSELSYDQLRWAFDRTATLGERARQFRSNRLQAVVEGKTWRPMTAGPICAVHLIPIASMSGRKSIDIRALYYDYVRFISPDWGGGSRTLNLDGLVIHLGESNGNGALAFTQVFRSGALEALRHGGWATEPKKRSIPSSTITTFFRDTILKFIKDGKSFGFTGQAVIGAALLFADGYELGLPSALNSGYRPIADRDHLILPEVWLDSIDVEDPDSVVRPLLDMLWQSFGVERCHSYDKQGVWTST